MNLIKTLFFTFALVFILDAQCSMNDGKDNNLKQNKKTFLDIPIELQAHIGTFLDQKSFINFFSAHPSFRNAVNLIRYQKELNLKEKILVREDYLRLLQIPFSILNLKRCSLKDSDIIILSECTFFKGLYLGSNNIGVEGAKALSTGNLVNLLELDLYGNNIGVEGITAIALGNLTSLQKLYLGSNNIGAEGAKALATGNLVNLLELDLYKNNIGVEGITAIAVGNFTSLQTLKLINNCINDKGVVALATGKLNKIQNLDLSLNGITIEGVKAIIAGSLTTLKSLNFEYNNINNQEAHDFKSNQYIFNITF